MEGFGNSIIAMKRSLQEDEYSYKRRKTLIFETVVTICAAAVSTIWFNKTPQHNSCRTGDLFTRELLDESEDEDRDANSESRTFHETTGMSREALKLFLRFLKRRGVCEGLKVSAAEKV